MGQNEDYDRPSLQGRENDVNQQDEELLVRLMEECGEVIQAAAKVLRWGWSSQHPSKWVQGDNAELLERELNDVHDIERRLRNHNAPPLRRDRRNERRSGPGLADKDE